MKARFLFFSFLLFSGIINAQDTIFVKGGQVIPATIVGKDAMEIQYKKFGQPEPAAIYSVFISDILSIHYKDGIVADYTSTGPDPAKKKPETAADLAGTMRVAKFSIGMSANYFKRNEADNLLLFWKSRNGENGSGIISNPHFYPIIFRMSFPLGNSGRSWLGDDFQLIFTPKDAIHASNASGSNVINQNVFYMIIGLYYGHTLNHKKNLLAIIEPGLDMGFMSGYFKLNNKNYKTSGNMGGGFHLALGTDWIISRRFLASVRVGQRFLNVKEVWYENKDAKYGLSRFYITEPSVNDNYLSVKWNGWYASAGLSWSFYTKNKAISGK
jgi:hypothetical protein